MKRDRQDRRAVPPRPEPDPLFTYDREEHARLWALIDAGDYRAVAERMGQMARREAVAEVV